MKRFLAAASVFASLQMFAPQLFAAPGYHHYGHGHQHSGHWGSSFSFGYSSWGPSWYWGGSWGYPYRPYSYHPSTAIVYQQPYYSSRPNYALGGALLGGILGGLIGESSGHCGWEGAAIGAGAGLILGSVAESQAYRRAVQSADPYASQSYYQPESPLAPSANRQVPQIPDAPRVPDAPSIADAPDINFLFGR